MFRRWPILVLLCAALIALVSPLFLAQQVARSSAQNQALVTLKQFTEHLLRRSEKTREQVTWVLANLQQNQALPCSVEQREYMLDLLVSAPYLRGAGYIADGKLLCSTLSEESMDIALEPPELLSEHGMYLWNNVQINPQHRSGFNLNGFTEKGFVVVVAPELAIDVLPDGLPLSLLQVGASSGRVIRSHGFYQLDWFDRLSGQDKTFYSDGYLVHSVLSSSGHTVAIAAMPEHLLTQYLHRAQAYILPWGALVGLLLVALVYLYGKDRLSLKGRLQAALKNNELHLLYQPIIELQSGRCIGAEALLRWRTARGEMISPEYFIGVAEQRGMMRGLTQYVLDHISQDAPKFFAKAPNAHIAINFSAQDFHSQWLLEALTALVIKSDACAQNFVVEATERGFIDPLLAQPVLASLREQGFKVAIDDFGTGNSSLSYLASYQLDFLKLDKLFVSNLGHDSAASRIATQIIEMAHGLNLEVIAEGVETPLQQRALSAAGVRFAQGYLYAKPLTIDEIIHLVDGQIADQLLMPSATGR